MRSLLREKDIVTMAVMNYLRMIAHFSRMLYQNSYMIRSMVIRDMRARYVGSLMGFFWSVLHPLTQLILYYFVFAVILKVRLGPEYGGTSFALWLIAGLLPWLFFAEVVTRAPSTVLNQSNLIKKMAFPSEILPIVNLAVALVSHLIGLSILLVFLLIFGDGISWKIFWILPYMLLAVIFALGISWLLSALNVFLRDVDQIIGVVVNIWFFMTPIIYPRHAVPKILQGFFELNPMFHVVEGYRMALLGKTAMDATGYAYLLFMSLAVIILGGLTFRRLKPAFADVL